ncbi:hypothetical protein TCON_1612 [Astathelohania contejeani]|uniref:Uncharacterized protein n=1 Tax=Astathelohania contejeani TaxID=164912 RepID=A0ABQ7HYJ2_9MICR|nr:hypothetical protein TCON_1612 [Thelohania contejeani]
MEFQDLPTIKLVTKTNIELTGTLKRLTKNKIELVNVSFAISNEVNYDLKIKYEDVKNVIFIYEFEINELYISLLHRLKKHGIEVQILSDGYDSVIFEEKSDVIEDQIESEHERKNADVEDSISNKEDVLENISNESPFIKHAKAVILKFKSIMDGLFNKRI